MPFYEYECGACGHHHEALQKVSDAALRQCPRCGKPRLRKLMSAPVFRLKGSGWYETDFKSDSENKRNLAVEKDEAPKSAGDQKADKPAEKPADKGAGEAGGKTEPKPADKPQAPAAAKPAKPVKSAVRARTRRPASRRAKR